jgi:hypothetical protein
MPKPDPIQTTISHLSSLANQDPKIIAPELKKALSNKSNLIVAKAADIIRQSQCKSLEAELVAAFNRFLIGRQSKRISEHSDVLERFRADKSNPDKGCLAKQAIVNAIYELAHDSDETRALLVGATRYTQREGSFGPAQDSAATMRGLAALALVRMAHRDVMNILVELLADPCPETRILAVRALAYSGRDDAALLLHYKILAGDKDESVLAESLTALAQLSGPKCLPLLSRLLDSPPTEDLFPSIAIAVAEIRHADALKVLLAKYQSSFSQETRKELLLPIALTRIPEAIDFLLTIVESGPEALAFSTLDALTMYRHDATIREKISAAVQRRSSEEISAHLQKKFPE